MGLAALVIEAAGIATVSLSMVPDFTAAAGAPRVAAIEYPCGVPLGMPGDRAGQMAVLRAALDVLRTATRPGQVVDLPFVWPDPPRASRFEPPEPPPIAQLLKRQPWLLRRLLSGDIPSHDAA
ncbi:MAG TPA: hypothetical protein VK923_15050 [Euzebyales bacterium]|nr:hypothetical protein [Euzebyales bacterium]